MDLILEVTSSDPSRQLSRLLHIPLGLDIWEAKKERLVVRATEAQATRLEQLGYTLRQVAAADAHVAAFATESAQLGYHSAQTLEDELRALAEAHPEIAELREVGRSVEGRPIWVLRIGDRSGGAKPKVLFMGCHHAREWIAVEVPFMLAKELVEQANDAQIAEWLVAGEVWVAPMVNPDGHEFSRTSDRLWRKNRRVNADGSIGVDPNRNYGYMWGTLDVPTSSHTPSDQTYVGPFAFSEPETRAVRDLVACQRFNGVVSFHSFSQLILHPWGYTTDPVANTQDREAMIELANEMKVRIHAVHQKDYTAEQSSELYPTAGDTTDWTYGTYRIPSFTIELRPRTVEEGGFILPAAEIGPTWEENRPAAFFLLDRILKQAEPVFAAA